MATSLLEPQPPSLARQHYRGQTAARRKAIKLLRFAGYVALIAFAVAGFYLGKRGFGRQWRDRVTEELRKRGVEADMRRLTLDPFRGLVAQDVRVFDFKNRENVLAVISEVAVDINYAALLHHQPFLNALDVRDARVTIPLGATPGLPDRARVTNFRAHVLFPPEQIYVTEADGVFAGIRISATGQLIKVNDYKPGPETSAEEWRKRMLILQRIVSEINKCNFAGTTPTVLLKFSADLSKPAGARGSMNVRADRVLRGAYESRDFAAAAEWADRKLAITQFEWRDGVGTFAGRANWDSVEQLADFQGRSTLSFRQFMEAAGFGNIVADTTFGAPPVIEFSGQLDLRPTSRTTAIIGRLAATDFSYKSVPFASLNSDFSWDGARTMLRNFRVRHETGEIAGDVLDAPGDFRLNVESSISPRTLAPLLPPVGAKILGEWEWQRPPHFKLSVRGAERGPDTWTGDGSLEFGRARFRGVGMNSVATKLRFADHSINFDNFRITRDEGIGAGSCAYDFAKHEVRFANVKTTLRPTDAIIWIEPKLFKHIAPYKFRQVPSVTTNGVVQFHGGTADHLELVVDAPGGMDYGFLGKTLPVDRVGARLLFTNDRLQIMDLNGALFGGTIRGGADISLAKGDDHYRASIAVDGVDFPRLTDLYFKYQTSHGRLAGSFDWTGVGDESRSIKGTGRMRVSEGNVFAIPIFGPLSSILGAIFPGAGYSVAHQATADFSINDGVIHTDNFKVSGKLFGMLGHGDIRFVEDRLDLDVKISGGGAGALLTPVYNLFEYKGEGTISKPNWHPKHF